MGIIDFITGGIGGAGSQDTAWAPESDPLWKNFLSNVFGEQATDVGMFPEPVQEQSRMPSLSLNMGDSGGSRSSSSSQSGTSMSMPSMQMRKSSVSPVELDMPSSSALSMDSNSIVSQQGQPNVFQPLQEYARNLESSFLEEGEDQNKTVQVLPNGTVLLRIRGQWVALGQQPQQQSTQQG